MRQFVIIGAVILFVMCCVHGIGLVLILAVMKKQNDPAYVGNTDTMMRKFCYRVEKMPEEILAALSVPGHFRDYRYEFDREEMTVTFSKDQVYPVCRYSMYLYPDDTGCRMRIETLDGWGVGNSFPQIQNDFWRFLLDARPIPYFEEMKP